MHLRIFVRKALEIRRFILAGEAMEPAQIHFFAGDLACFQIMLHVVCSDRRLRCGTVGSRSGGA